MPEVCQFLSPRNFDIFCIHSFAFSLLVSLTLQIYPSHEFPTNPDASRRKRTVTTTNSIQQPHGGSSFSRHFNPSTYITGESQYTPPLPGRVALEDVNPIMSSSSNHNQLNSSQSRNLYKCNFQTPNGSTPEHPPAPSAVVTNPYKITDQSNRPHGEVIGGGGSASIGRQVTPLERQHPHRAGRIRTDRQFGTALEIFCGEEDNADASAGPSVALTGVAQTQLPMNAEDGDEDEDKYLLSFDTFGKR